MSNAVVTPKKQGLAAPWQPGRSGNPAGRPQGARSKLSEEFLAELHAHFLANGADAIDRVCREDPVAYIKIIASLVPRQSKVDEADDQYAHRTDEEIMERIRELDRQIAAADGPDWLYRGLPDKSGDKE